MAASTSSPSLTCTVCSLNGRRTSFSSPQSRNAPIFVTCETRSFPTSPTHRSGEFVVAMILSFESLYKNTSISSPILLPCGTCFFGRSTLSSMDAFNSSPRYTPKSSSFTIISDCFFPNSNITTMPFSQPAAFALQARINKFFNEAPHLSCYILLITKHRMPATKKPAASCSKPPRAISTRESLNTLSMDSSKPYTRSDLHFT